MNKLICNKYVNLSMNALRICGTPSESYVLSDLNFDNNCQHEIIMKLSKIAIRYTRFINIYWTDSLFCS